METNEEIAKEVGIDNIADTIKLGSPEEAAWRIILKNNTEALAQARRQIEIGEILIPFIEKRIAEEQEKFQKENS